MKLYQAIDTETESIYQHFSVLRIDNKIPEVIFIGTLFDWVGTETGNKHEDLQVKRIIKRHKHPIFVI